MIRSVAVIGSGIMGQGIAQACAVAGFNIVLFDLDIALASTAVKQIGVNLSQAVSKGRMTEAEKQQALSRVSTVNTLSDVRGELIIEAIVEKLEPKQAVLARVEENNKEAILATNTSTFPVDKVAALLKNPANCVDFTSLTLLT
jgi:3-hydroxybutyryl-CoA dehydrogenase